MQAGIDNENFSLNDEVCIFDESVLPWFHPEQSACLR